MIRHRSGLIVVLGAVIVGKVVGSFSSLDDPNGRPHKETDPFFDLSDMTAEQKADIFQIALEIKNLGDKIRWPQQEMQSDFSLDRPLVNGWDENEVGIDDDNYLTEEDVAVDRDERTQDFLSVTDDNVDFEGDSFESTEGEDADEQMEVDESEPPVTQQQHTRGLRSMYSGSEDSRELQQMTRAPRARPRKGKGGKGGGKKGGKGSGKGGGKGGKKGKGGSSSSDSGDGKKGGKKGNGGGKMGKKGPVSPVAPFASPVFSPASPPNDPPTRRPSRPSPPSNPPNGDSTRTPQSAPVAPPVDPPTNPPVQPGQPTFEPNPPPTPSPVVGPDPPTPPPTRGPDPQTPPPTRGPDPQTPPPAVGPDPPTLPPTRGPDPPTPPPAVGPDPPTPPPTQGPTQPPAVGPGPPSPAPTLAPGPGTNPPTPGGPDLTAFPTPTGPFVRCFVEDSPDIGCPAQDIAASCDKYNPLSSFQSCFANCIDAFCCIHDSAANRSPSCSAETNCVFYDPCYIIWFKLHDTIGPAPYLRLDQSDDFYDVNNDDFVQIFIDRPDFFDQFFGHHFLTDDLPLVDETFEDETNW